jgi:hypothetical protein
VFLSAARPKPGYCTEIDHTFFLLTFYNILNTTIFSCYSTLNSCSILFNCGVFKSTASNSNTLRVFENRVLRKIFVPKRDEMARDFSKLHNEELHNMYSPPRIFRMMN